MKNVVQKLQNVSIDNACFYYEYILWNFYILRIRFLVLFFQFSSIIWIKFGLEAGITIYSIFLCMSTDFRNVKYSLNINMEVTPEYTLFPWIYYFVGLICTKIRSELLSFIMQEGESSSELSDNALLSVFHALLGKYKNNGLTYGAFTEDLVAIIRSWNIIVH